MLTRRSSQRKEKIIPRPCSLLPTIRLLQNFHESIPRSCRCVRFVLQASFSSCISSHTPSLALLFADAASVLLPMPYTKGKPSKVKRKH